MSPSNHNNLAPTVPFETLEAVELVIPEAQDLNERCRAEIEEGNGELVPDAVSAEQEPKRRKADGQSPSRSRRSVAFAAAWRRFRMLGKKTVYLPFGRLRRLTVSRIVRGGHVTDLSRFPRYLVIIVLSLAAVWTPIVVYLKFAPIRYASEMSLILPGTGANTSVNLNDIGQASSSSSSPYASSSLSPTVLYQNLLSSPRVVERSALALGISEKTFGQPRIKLFDQTSLISVAVSGDSADEAHQRGDKLLEVFLSELDKLRNDDLDRRERSTRSTIVTYKEEVDHIQRKINALQAESGLISTDQYDRIVQSSEVRKDAIVDSQIALDQANQSIATLESLLRMGAETAALALALQADSEYLALSVASSNEFAKLSELERLYGPNHPKVAAAQKTYAGTKSEMLARGAFVTQVDGDALAQLVAATTTGEQSKLLSQLVTLRTERDGEMSRLAALQSQLVTAKAEVGRLLATVAELDTLNRDYKVAEAVFASALARIGSNKTDIFASYPMVQVVQPPTLPLSPTSPNQIIAVLAGIAASFLIIGGFVIAWMRRPILEWIVPSATQKT